MSNIKDYNLIRKIGEGGFGAVYIAQQNGKHLKLYAIKMQKKDRIMQNQHNEDRATAELKILQLAISKSFLTQIEASFMDMENLYIVMELEYGGDLHTFIHGSHYMPNEEIWKFIAVNIMLGLNQLEDINVIHNDLKPENVLIGSNGYLKITDFGLSSVGSTSQGKKGTKFYIAPECYKRAPYKRCAEMSHPFQTEQLLLKSQPAAALRLGSAAWKFMQGLLQKDPALGIRSTAQVKSAKCFEGVDFGEIEAQASTSPLTQYVKNHPVVTLFETIAFFKRDSPKKVVNLKSAACQVVLNLKNEASQAVVKLNDVGCQTVEKCRSVGCHAVAMCCSKGCQTSPVIIIQLGNVNVVEAGVQDVMEVPVIANVEELHEELSNAAQGEMVTEMVHDGHGGGVGKSASSSSIKHFFNDYLNVDGKFVCNIANCGCKKSFKSTKTSKQYARGFSCKALQMYKCGLCDEVFQMSFLTFHTKFF